MKFPMTFITTYTPYYDGPTSQTIKWRYDNFKGNFFVTNLCECPEDATITRDLFNGDDFIAAVSLGMELAKKGYTELEVTKIIEEEDEE